MLRADAECQSHALGHVGVVVTYVLDDQPQAVAELIERYAAAGDVDLDPSHSTIQDERDAGMSKAARSRHIMSAVPIRERRRERTGSP
jgi:hypothetical protein